MVPLFLDIEIGPTDRAQILVSAIGWLAREKSLTISLSAPNLSAAPISLLIRDDMTEGSMGELIDHQNDRIAIVTGIRGVGQVDRLLHQSLDLFIQSAPIEPEPPSLPIVPTYCR